MYAINLADLSALKSPGPINVAALLLADFLPHGRTPDHVCIDPSRLDTDAVILNGPVGSDVERCRALIEFVQTVLGPRKLHRRIRCYEQGPRGAWREIGPQEHQAEVERD